MTYGVFANSLAVTQFGYNPGVLQVGVMEDVSAAELSGGHVTIWSKNTLYPWGWTPGVLSFVSTSADDTAAGSGAQALLITGLDADLVEQTETLATSGLTPVVTEKSYARINDVTCVCGSGQTNTGNISGSSGAAVAAYIHTGHGHSMAAVYTIPSNWRNGAIVHRYWADRSSKQGGSAVSRLWFRVPGTNTWQLVGGFAATNTPANYITVAQIHVPPGTDMHGTLDDLDTNNDTVVIGLEFTQVPWRKTPWP